MSQDYLETLRALLLEQDPDVASSVNAASGLSRNDLGITSLNVILMIVNYIGERQVTVKPEWVAHLEDVDGICAVLRLIDEEVAQVGVPA